MNILLIFFAFPIAVIIISAILQRLINSPISVALLIFAIFLIVTFAAFDVNFLVATIIYTILAFITATIVKIISNCGNNICENLNNIINNAINSTNNEISTTNNIANSINENLTTNTSNCGCRSRYRRF